MSELQTSNIDNDETLEVESDTGNQSFKDEQLSDSLERNNEAERQLMQDRSELLQRQRGVEDLMEKFLERQQGVERLLGQLLQQQKIQNDNLENKLDKLEYQQLKSQTAEGKGNPGGLFIPMGSDRAIPDATPGYTWPTSSNPGDMSSRQDLVTSLAAPPKPTADYRATEVLPVGFDPVYSERTVFSGFPQPRAQSLEGATHVSIGTRSGVNNKEYR